ncbi:MAG: patatin-like phospholipase family protein [Bacillota bacterium]
MLPKVGLALSGGGVRGFAHLGVLKVFKKHHIPIDVIAGTSSGALVAAFYALGTDLEMLEKIFLRLDIKKLLNIRLHRMGFVSGDNLVQLIQLITQNRNIEDAVIPLRIVAADLINRETVVFTRGNVAECIRASIALPGIFTPVKKDGRLLVDGSVLNNCPCDVVKKDADIVIAVNLEVKTQEEPAHVFEVFRRSLELMAEARQLPLSDLVISPIKKPVSQFEFSRGKECLEMGERAAEEKIAEIKKLVGDFKKVQEKNLKIDEKN